MGFCPANIGQDYYDQIGNYYTLDVSFTMCVSVSVFYIIPSLLYRWMDKSLLNTFVIHSKESSELLWVPVFERLKMGIN